MKDPDGAYECIKEAAEQQVALIEGIDNDEKENLLESKHEKLQKIASKWFKYGEYLTVEIDTEAQTITVIPAL